MQSCPTSCLPASARRANARLLRTAGLEFKKGRLDSALSSCRQLLEADPSHLGALELLAKCLWSKQDFAALEQTTRSLIALNPYEPGYFGLQGMALRALGRYGEAARSLQRDPNSTSQLADLEAFQSTLVRDLVEHDAVFAAQFARSPEAAAKNKGLAPIPGNRIQPGASTKSNKAPSIRHYN